MRQNESHITPLEWLLFEEAAHAYSTFTAFIHHNGSILSSILMYDSAIY